MKINQSFMIAAAWLALAATTDAQSIYKCEQDGQTVYSQQPCAENAEKMEVEEAYSPDGSRQHTGIDFRRTSCQERGTGTAQAVVELANMTDEIKAGELRIQFVKGGQILDVAREQFLLAPWGSESFDRLGPVGVPIDNCEYRITVEG